METKSEIVPPTPADLIETSFSVSQGSIAVQTLFMRGHALREGYDPNDAPTKFREMFDSLDEAGYKFIERNMLLKHKSNSKAVTDVKKNRLLHTSMRETIRDQFPKPNSMERLVDLYLVGNTEKIDAALLKLWSDPLDLPKIISGIESLGVYLGLYGRALDGKLMDQEQAILWNNGRLLLESANQ